MKSVLYISSSHIILTTFLARESDMFVLLSMDDLMTNIEGLVKLWDHGDEVSEIYNLLRDHRTFIRTRSFDMEVANEEYIFYYLYLSFKEHVEVMMSVHDRDVSGADKCFIDNLAQYVTDSLCRIIWETYRNERFGISYDSLKSNILVYKSALVELLLWEKIKPTIGDLMNEKSAQDL